VNLSEAETEALEAAGDRWRMTTDANGWTCILIEGYRLPEGFSAQTVELLLHLNPQFPDAPPDMFYVLPRVTLTSTGRVPVAAEASVELLGRSWQRFSRHLVRGAWHSGDDLRTWLAAIRRLLHADVGLMA